MGFGDFLGDVFRQTAAGRAIGGARRLFGPRGENEFRDLEAESFGLPGGEARGERLTGAAEDFLNRRPVQAGATTLGQFGQTGVSDFRGGQQDLAAQLARRASGEESLSDIQLRQAAGRNIANQQALAAGARPGQAGAAGRTAAQQAATISQGLAGQAATAGIQERTAAQNILGQILSGARGQDIGAAQFNVGQLNQQLLEQARLQQANRQFNVGAEIQGQQLGQQGFLQSLELALANARAQQAGQFQFEAQRGQRFGALAGAPTFGESLLGAGAGVGAAFATCDRLLKEDIEEADESTDDFLKSLKAYTYNYKHPDRHGHGRRLGVMAQDLEKSHTGAATVVETEEGKKIDLRRLAPALLASLGRLNERLVEVEGK